MCPCPKESHTLLPSSPEKVAVGKGALASITVGASVAESSPLSPAKKSYFVCRECKKNKVKISLCLIITKRWKIQCCDQKILLPLEEGRPFHLPPP